MSGAGMSSFGPMNGARSAVNRRVIRDELGRATARAGCSARRPSRRRTGRRSSAHFQVIHIASAAHSPRLTSRVVADAALRRPEHGRVLHAVGRERADAAVVERDRQREDHGPLGVAEPLGHRLPGSPARTSARSSCARACRKSGVSHSSAGDGVGDLDHGADYTTARCRPPDCGPRDRECRVMPGEGIEPPRPRGAPGFKPSASDQFRHPGGAAKG